MGKRAEEMVSDKNQSCCKLGFTSHPHYPCTIVAAIRSNTSPIDSDMRCHSPRRLVRALQGCPGGYAALPCRIERRELWSVYGSDCIRDRVSALSPATLDDQAGTGYAVVLSEERGAAGT